MSDDVYRGFDATDVRARFGWFGLGEGHEPVAPLILPSEVWYRRDGHEAAVDESRTVSDGYGRSWDVATPEYRCSNLAPNLYDELRRMKGLPAARLGIAGGLAEPFQAVFNVRDGRGYVSRAFVERATLADVAASFTFLAYMDRVWQEIWAWRRHERHAERLPGGPTERQWKSVKAWSDELVALEEQSAGSPYLAAKASDGLGFDVIIDACDVGDLCAEKEVERARNAPFLTSDVFAATQARLEPPFFARFVPSGRSVDIVELTRDGKHPNDRELPQL